GSPRGGRAPRDAERLTPITAPTQGDGPRVSPRGGRRNTGFAADANGYSGVGLAEAPHRGGFRRAKCRRGRRKGELAAVGVRRVLPPGRRAYRSNSPSLAPPTKA